LAPYCAPCMRSTGRRWYCSNAEDWPKEPETTGQLMRPGKQAFLVLNPLVSRAWSTLDGRTVAGLAESRRGNSEKTNTRPRCVPHPMIQLPLSLDRVPRQICLLLQRQNDGARESGQWVSRPGKRPFLALCVSLCCCKGVPC
jgi:hypothetical protein